MKDYPTQERNEAMFRAWLNGAMYVTLARNHGVTPARVRQICLREQKRADAKNPLTPGPKQARRG